jgi:hypothetical protein
MKNCRRPLPLKALSVVLWGLAAGALAQSSSPRPPSEADKQWAHDMVEKLLKEPPKPPRMDSIPDFQCRDITPVHVQGLDTTFTWTNRLKIMEITDWYDARYKALSVVADTGLQAQEFPIGSVLSEKDQKALQKKNRKEGNPEPVTVLRSDPTGLSIMANLHKTTKYSRELKAATLWFSVTRSYMPMSFEDHLNWIATASITLNRDIDMEVTPGKEAERSTFLLACKFLTKAEQDKKDIVDKEREEEEARQEEIRLELSGEKWMKKAPPPAEVKSPGPASVNKRAPVAKKAPARRKKKR